MPDGQPSASPVRLPAKKGMALLRMGRLPAIDCPVMDIGRTNCTCRITWKMVESSKVQAWKMLLVPGAKLKLNLTSPPYLISAQLDAKVQLVGKSAPTHQDLTLHFFDVDDETNAKLQSTVKALEVKKSEETVTLRRGSPHAVDSGLRSTRLMKLAEQCRGRPFEELIVGFKKASDEQMANARMYAQKFGEDLGSSLIRMGILNAVELCRIWALQSGLPVVATGQLALAKDPPEDFDYPLMQEFECIPFQETPEAVYVAVARPPSGGAEQRLSERVGKRIKFYLAATDELQDVLFGAASQKHLSRRKYPRYKTSISLVFQLCDSLGFSLQQQLSKGHTVDVSEGGLAIKGIPGGAKTPEALMAKKPWCRVAFSYPPYKMQALCRICHVQKCEDGGDPEEQWLYGVQIMDIGTDDRTCLKEICGTLEKEIMKSGQRS